MIRNLIIRGYPSIPSSGDCYTVPISGHLTSFVATNIEYKKNILPLLAIIIGLQISSTIAALPRPRLPSAPCSILVGNSLKGDITNADQVAFDDSKWTDVSAPHTYNDVDSYTDISATAAATVIPTL